MRLRGAPLTRKAAPADKRRAHGSGIGAAEPAAGGTVPIRPDVVERGRIDGPGRPAGASGRPGPRRALGADVVGSSPTSSSRASLASAPAAAPAAARARVCAREAVPESGRPRRLRGAVGWWSSSPTSSSAGSAACSPGSASSEAERAPAPGASPRVAASVELAGVDGTEARAGAEAVDAAPLAEAAPEREDVAGAEDDMAYAAAPSPDCRVFDARKTRTEGETGYEKERHMQGKENANCRTRIEIATRETP